MTDRNGQHGSNGKPSGKPLGSSDAAVLRAIESAEAPAGDAGAALDPVIAGLRADRLALMASAEVTAPAGLLDAALDEAETLGERDLLLGLSASGDADGPLPISKVVPKKDSLIDRVFDRPMRWAVAAAASLLIALGVGAAILAARLQDRFTNGEPPPIIANNQPAPTPTVEPADPGTPSTPNDTAIAANEPANAGTATPTDPARDVPTIVTLADATRLMQQGRLAVRVRTAGDGLAMLDTIRAERADRLDATWTVRGVAPQALAAAMPELRAAPVAKPGLDPTAVATSGDPLGRPIVETDPQPKIERLGVWTARVDRRGTALASLGAGLERAGFVVEYIALEQVAPEPPVLDATAVQWWSRPASMWPDSVTIPLIVETER